MSFAPADLDSEDPDRPVVRDAAAEARPVDPTGRGADGLSRRPGVVLRTCAAVALAWGTGVLAQRGWPGGPSPPSAAQAAPCSRR